MLLNIFKPKKITSHDVVNEVRKATGEKRVGHAGTLDPFATGVLVVGIGRESTKKLGDISKNTEKEYITTLELGKTSSTGDIEGVIKEVSLDVVHPPKGYVRHPQVESLSFSQIIKVLETFTGKIKQKPHKYSAVKINGEPAYKKARRGEDFEIPEKEVEIKEIELLEYNYPYLKIRVVCGGGTYIRSLAEDIGKKLGTGAYLTELTRVRVGEYKIEDSKTLKELEFR
jgi:tRNA pseudouridine55 synthase